MRQSAKNIRSMDQSQLENNPPRPNSQDRIYDQNATGTRMGTIIHIEQHNKERSINGVPWNITNKNRIRPRSNHLQTITTKENTESSKHSIHSKVVLNRNFPTAVFQGPVEYGGLAHLLLYTQQGYKQIQLLVGTIRNEDDTGKLIKAFLAYEQQKIRICNTYPSHHILNKIQTLGSRNTDRSNQKLPSQNDS